MGLSVLEEKKSAFDSSIFWVLQFCIIIKEKKDFSLKWHTAASVCGTCEFVRVPLLYEYNEAHSGPYIINRLHLVTHVNKAYA